MRSIRQRLTAIEARLLPKKRTVFKIIYQGVNSCHAGGWVIFGDPPEYELLPPPDPDVDVLPPEGSNKSANLSSSK